MYPGHCVEITDLFPSYRFTRLAFACPRALPEQQLSQQEMNEQQALIAPPMRAHLQAFRGGGLASPAVKVRRSLVLPCLTDKAIR